MWWWDSAGASVPVTERCQLTVPALLNCSSCSVASEPVGIFRLATRLGMSHWIFGHSWPKRARQPFWDRVLSQTQQEPAVMTPKKLGEPWLMETGLRFS